MQWLRHVCIGLGALVVSTSCSPAISGRERGMVTEVVDGDTIVVRRASGEGRTVRILGVDTPETKKPGVPVQCFGPEASEYTHRQLLGESVELRLDIEHRDRYGRTLAYVAHNGVDHGRDLLAQGYARLLVIAPNGRRAREYLQVELQARRTQRGLWGACPDSGR